MEVRELLALVNTEINTEIDREINKEIKKANIKMVKIVGGNIKCKRRTVQKCWKIIKMMTYGPLRMSKRAAARPECSRRDDRTEL